MRPALRSLAVLAGLLVVYYAIPIGELPSTLGAVVSVLGILAAGALLGWLITDQVRRQLRVGDHQDVRIQSLLVLIYLTVVLFSLGYLGLAEAADRQFAGLETKTDALYFTVTTLATVGFGDVTATGQIARALVTAQIVFNLVFVGMLASTITGRVRQRAASVTGRPPETPPPDTPAP